MKRAIALLLQTRDVEDAEKHFLLCVGQLLWQMNRYELDGVHVRAVRQLHVPIAISDRAVQSTGGSRIRGKPMMASIPRSWSRRPGTAHRPSSLRTLIAARAASLPPRIFSWDGSRMIVVMP